MTKTSTIKLAILSAFALLLNVQAQAQVKIGNNPTVRNTNAELEIESASRGFLLPRVALTSTTSFAPLTAHVAGMTVYNTLATGDVVAGYYYNDGTKWVQLGAASSGSFWGLTGNTGTNDANNFVGTTDAQALHFRVNGVSAGLLDYSSSAQGAYPGANVILGYNAAPGITSVLNNASNNNNVIIGYEAGKAQTASYRNVYVGARAGMTTTTAHENVVMGWEAAKLLTSGSWNTSVGVYAGQGMTTGTENISLGFHAGEGITTGGANTSIGSYAGGSNATGSNNTFLGWGAGASVDALANATAIGKNARVGISNALVLGGTGADAVKVGIGTTSPVWDFDLVGNVDGNVASRIYNTSTGTNASTTLVFGNDVSSNAALIYKTGGANSGTSGMNNLVFNNIGSTAADFLFVQNGAEKMRIKGNGNVGIGTTAPTATLHVVGTTLAAAWTVSSDARLKTNIVKLGEGTLNKVMQLQPVSYEKKESLESTNYNTKEMGFIAQDLRKIFPNVVQENGKDKLLSVNYTALIPVLTKSVQELKKENDDLKQEVAQLKAQMAGIASLAEQVKELQALVSNNKAVNATEATVKTGKK